MVRGGGRVWQTTFSVVSYVTFNVTFLYITFKFISLSISQWHSSPGAHLRVCCSLEKRTSSWKFQGLPVVLAAAILDNRGLFASNEPPECSFMCRFRELKTESLLPICLHLI